MFICTINAGGSSVRVSTYQCYWSASTSPRVKSVDQQHHKGKSIDADKVVRSVLSQHDHPITAIVHRVVHGGNTFHSATVIDDDVVTQLSSLSSFDPLHMPIALTWIKAARRADKQILNVAVFDTSFFSSLPRLSVLYAVPREWENMYHVKRYGFHGMAHQSMLNTLSQHRKDLPSSGRVITVQLGSGCSVTACCNGSPIDTSMGFGPLEGLVMSSRSGDIDPAAVLYMQRVTGMNAEDMEKQLYFHSGLVGLSPDQAGDMQQLLQSESESEDAKQAVNLFCYRLVKYIGAYVAVLGGVDALVFGGGIGEQSPVIRQRVVSRLKHLNVELDEKVNEEKTETGRISSATSAVDVWVVAVDEASIMLQESKTIITKHATKRPPSTSHL